MKEEQSATHPMHLSGLAAAVSLCYLLALGAVDNLLYPEPVFKPSYYLFNGNGALVVLALACWSRHRVWAARVCVPVSIILMAVTPIVTSHLAAFRVAAPPPPPQASPEGIMLRLLPLLLMVLIVVAWQYRWRWVVAFILTIAAVHLGQVVFIRPEGAPFVPPMLVVVIQTVSFLLVGRFIATMMSRLQAQRASLERANAQLVRHAGALEELTISRERNRMARELHDTLAHSLSALSVQLETAKAYFDVNPDVTRNLLDKSLAATRSGLVETRRALKSLRASPLDDLGVLLALREMAEEAAARGRLTLCLVLPEQLESLSPALEQTLYRVAQEAVANVVHHANARTLTLRFTVAENSSTLIVSDDGTGFDVREAEAPGHFGLAGMRERAQLVGGQLSVDSRPGYGTTVRLEVRGGGA